MLRSFEMGKRSGNLFAEERLIADVQYRIQKLMNLKGTTRAELARRLDVSEARVSQIFSQSPRNLTLRTVADIFNVLGEECKLTSPSLDRAEREGRGADVENRSTQPAYLQGEGAQPRVARRRAENRELEAWLSASKSQLVLELVETVNSIRISNDNSVEYMNVLGREHSALEKAYG